MHSSAMLRMKWFVDNYVPTDRSLSILDIGSGDVNGSYRTLFEGYEFHVVDVTVGGIPEDHLTDEWINDNADDTMMVITKILLRFKSINKLSCISAFSCHDGYRYFIMF